jgi:hypothetical protein
VTLYVVKREKGGEGNYLEPDLKYDYINIFRRAVKNNSVSNLN